MKRVRFKPRPLAIAGLAVLLTLVGIVLALNFIGGEKKIERRIERLHTLDDPRFHQELGLLLGPQFIAGNGVQVLRNGDTLPRSIAASFTCLKSSRFEPEAQAYPRPAHCPY